MIEIQLYIVGFFASFVTQSFFQKWFGKSSVWKENRGWQNEIAIWNLGVGVILYGLLKQPINNVTDVKLGLFTLSLLFLANHSYALLKDPKAPSHLLGALLNMLGVVVLSVSFF